MSVSVVLITDEVNNIQLCVTGAWGDRNHTVNKVLSNGSGLEYIPIESGFVSFKMNANLTAFDGLNP